MNPNYLDFEQPIAELEVKIEELQLVGSDNEINISEEIETLREKAGIAKGTRRGAVGVSTRHALALVHHGGGTTAELLAFADEIRARVRDRFGVELEREPRLLA